MPLDMNSQVQVNSTGDCDWAATLLKCNCQVEANS